MAATASIIIEVNDQGATQAFQRINAESATLGRNLQPIAGQSDQAFGAVAVGARTSREQVALLSEEMGIGIPRAMRGVIAGMPGISSAINAAFSGMVIVGFIQIIANAVDKLTGFSEQMKILETQNKATFQTISEANKTLLGPKTLDQVNAQILKTQQNIDGLAKSLGLLGENPQIDAVKRGIISGSGGMLGDALTGGFDAARAQQAAMLQSYDAQKAKLEELYAEQAKLTDEQKRTEPVEVLKAENEARLAGLQGIAKINEEERGGTAVIVAEMAARIKTMTAGQAEIVDVHAQAAAKRKEYERSVTETIIGLQKEATLSGQNEVMKLAISTAAEIDKIDRLWKEGKISFEQAEAEKTAVATAANNKRAEMERDTALAGERAVLQAQAASVGGRVQIETEYAAKIKEIENQEVKSGINAQRQKDAALIEENTKLLNLAQERADEENKLETAAAIASLPPWQRADAQIVADAQERIDKIREMETKDATFREQGEREVGLVMQKEWHDRIDNMANQMETLFDDLTSGNAGKAFLKEFEHLVFQMLATWIMGMKGMTAATQQTMSTSGGGVLAVISNLLGGRGVGSAAAGAASTSAAAAGGDNGAPSASLADLINLGVTSDSSAAAYGGAAAGGGSTTGTAATTGASLSNLMKSGMLNQLLMTGGAGLLVNGAERGGILGVFEAATGGAMAGFGVGAMIGSAFGPLGMGIGALIGGIVGIISSLFGEHKGDKARKEVIEPLEAQIKTLESSYDVFQTDYNTSVATLEQLRSDAIAALRKIGGGQVKGNTQKTNADIDTAEQYLKTTEAERQRRTQMDFGPPQFRTGGFVDGSLAGRVPSWFGPNPVAFAGGGAVPAILHGGEFVVNAAATERIGAGNLARMNAGGSGDGAHIDKVVIQTIDSKSFKRFLDDGGLKALRIAIVGAINAGAW